MSRQKSTQQIESKLSKFHLSFEYDKTLREIKHDVRERTHAA